MYNMCKCILYDVSHAITKYVCVCKDHTTSIVSDNWNYLS